MNRVPRIAVALIALVSALALWVYTLSHWSDTPQNSDRRTSPALESPARADESGAPSIAAPRVTPERATVLTPPPKIKPAPRAAAEDIDPDTLAAPKPGTLRIEGEVLLDGEPLEVDGANVRIQAGSDGEPSARPLGVAPVFAGRFRFEVPSEALARLQRLGALTGGFALVLTAPGCHPTDVWLDASEAEGGLLRAQLETSVCRVSIMGRVIDHLGQPIRSADVVAVRIDPTTLNVDTDQVQSDAAGHFQSSFERHGLVEVVARHAAYGIARVGGVPDEATGLLDVGDLVLTPRGVVAGTLRGFGRTPLARHGLNLWPLDDESGFDSQRVFTDERGQFQLANLDQTAYRIWIDGVDERADDQRPVVTPDVTGLELFVLLPSARVRVVGPTRELVPDVSLTVRAMQRTGETWRAAEEGGVSIEPSQADPGVFHLCFQTTGTYSVTAHAWTEDGRWIATKRIEVSRAHEDITLVLEREQRRTLGIEVLGLDGLPITEWHVRFVSAATGVPGSVAEAPRNRVELADGHWTALVEPRGETYALPFTTEVMVASSTEVIALRATGRGGRLAVATSSGSKDTWTPAVSLVHSESGASHSFTIESDGNATFERSLPPGEYSVTVGTQIRFGQPAGTLMFTSQWLHAGVQVQPASPTRTVTIRAGEVTWLRLDNP